jgi:AraC-like DNA-binding protein
VDARVIRHESEHDRWEFVERRPPPRLRGHVLDYVAYDERTTSFLTRLETPSKRVPLILNLGPTLEVSGPAYARPWRTPELGFFASLHDSHALVRSPGHQRGIEVNLTPLGAHRLLGVPMHETTSRPVELEWVLGREGVDLVERLREARGWSESFELLDRFLVRRLDRSAASPELTWAWNVLDRSAGRVEVRAIARELGWSHRRLIARFREGVGLPPKLMARILRFDRATGLVRAGTRMGWAELAADCGYYDQAHLIRDFRRFAGSTPAEYAARVAPGGAGVIGD